MNLITVIIISITICSILADDNSNDGEKLSDCYERMNNILVKGEKSHFYDGLRTANRNCVKQKLQLNTKGNKKIDEQTCQLMFIATFWVCVENVDEFTNKQLAEFIDLTQDKYERDLDCYKSALYRLESTSTLIQNYDNNTATKTVDQCINITIEPYQLYKQIFGDLGQMSCGLITLLDVEKFFYKLVIIKINVKDEQSRNSEINKLRNIFLPKINDVIKCFNGEV